MSTLRLRSSPVLAAALVAALGACSDQVAAPTEPVVAKPLFHVDGPQITPSLFGPTIVPLANVTTAAGHVAICKTGTSATIRITIQQQAGTLPSPSDVVVFQHDITLQSGQCAVFHATHPQQYTIRATELTATGTVLDNITAFTIGTTPSAVVCGTNAIDLCAINLTAGNITVAGITVPPRSVIFGELNVFHGGMATFFNHADICTVTKGFYRNHDDVVAHIIADMGGTLTVGGAALNAAQVQAILDATPGKPGNVTFSSNALLNLAQQTITALLNVHGDVSLLPSSVQSALGGFSVSAGGTIQITSGLSQTAISSRIDTLSRFNEGGFAGFDHCTDAEEAELIGR